MREARGKSPKNTFFLLDYTFMIEIRGNKLVFTSWWVARIFEGPDNYSFQLPSSFSLVWHKQLQKMTNGLWLICRRNIICIFLRTQNSSSSSTIHFMYKRMGYVAKMGLIFSQFYYTCELTLKTKFIFLSPSTLN